MILSDYIKQELTNTDKEEVTLDIRFNTDMMVEDNFSCRMIFTVLRKAVDVPTRGRK